MRLFWCLLLAFTATHASAQALVAPPRWTRMPLVPRDVLVYAWVEDADGEFLLGVGPQYLASGAAVPLDLSLIPSGTYVCVRGWAYSTALERRGWSSFATADGVCFEMR